MKYIYRLFFSVGAMTLMILIYLVALIFGTFIENDFGTQSAKLLIYNAKWMEVLTFLIAVNLIINVFRYRMFRKEKIAAFVFHLSFLIIIIGAAVTRYFGFEGIMNIPEGKSVGYMHSPEPYLMLTAHDNENQFYYENQYFASPILEDCILGDNKDETTFQLNGHKPVKFEVLEYIPKAVDSIEIDDSFNTILELVVPSEKGGMRSVYLQNGDVLNEEGLKIAFNNDDHPDAIKLVSNGAQVSINSPYDIAFMKMSDQSRGEIKKDSTQPFLQRQLHQVNGKSFVFKQIYESASLNKVSLGVKAEQGIDMVRAKLTQGNEEKEFYLTGGEKRIPNFETFQFNGINYRIGYGAKIISLPFLVGLRKFTLETYPGSDSPSSYSSDVVVLDSLRKKPLEYKIYMNHVLDYGGYRFFQSSYTPEGTVLSVNHDWWGTNITYLGYLLMGIGMFLSLLMPGSRFKDLVEKLKKPKTTNLLVLGFLLSSPALVFAQTTPTHDHANHSDSLSHQQHIDTLSHDEHKHNHNQSHTQEDPHTHSKQQVLPELAPAAYGYKIDKKHAEKFGTIVSHSHEGRMMPLNTIALNILRKVHRKDYYETKDGEKLTPMQVYLDMQINQKRWIDEPIILVSVKDFREEFGLKEKYVSMRDFINEKEQHGGYILSEYVKQANQKSDKDKSKRDKEIIKVNDRFQALNMALSGYYTQIYPNPSDTSDKWHSPQQALFRYADKDSTFAALQYIKYLAHLKTAIGHGNYDTCDIIVDEIIATQRMEANDVMPTEQQVKLEILYNKSNIFYRTSQLYMVLGFILLIILFIEIFVHHKEKSRIRLNTIAKILSWLIGISALLHGLGLGVRWYISGHAPWSDGFEALVFIAFVVMVVGIAFAKRSKITLSLAAILSFLMLFVAHMEIMNPEITNLVPVLKSYWLKIHVAVITSSYAFLGISCMLGILNMVFFIIQYKKWKKGENTNYLMSKYNELTYINEMVMTIGLFMLSVGTFLGGVWANESWGRYWGWDAKETWAFISMLVYSIILHFRFIPKLKSKIVLNFSAAIGYVAILFTFFGVNYLLSGLHSYAKGDPAPIPNWVFYTIGVVVAMGVVAIVMDAKKKKLN